MGAPLGNKNGVKAKPWGDAIRRAIARHDRDKPEDEQFLNQLANQLLKNCLNGEKNAIDELTNRLDGKHVQPATLGNDPESGPFEVVLPWLQKQIQDRNSA